jgi:uncharacterized membrane protein
MRIGTYSCSPSLFPKEILLNTGSLPRAPADAPGGGALGGGALGGTDLPGSELLGRIVTVNRNRFDLYDFWRNFGNLPRFMSIVRSVAPIDSINSHWVVVAGGGQTIEWDVMVVDDVPGKAIAWTSADNAILLHSGRVEFRDAPTGHGTEVAATILYEAPAAAAGAHFAAQFQKGLKTQVLRDLQRFKQIMEENASPP